MRAIVLDNHAVSLRHDYPEPAEVLGEAIVKVRLAGICGTDLELVRGYMDYRGVPGHEFVAEVVDSEDPALLGRTVVGEINAACGRCDFCVQDLGRHCPNRTVLGILGRDGAFAEYLRLPERNLLVVPDSVPDELAVFTEPVAAAYEILDQEAIPRKASILVLGDGRLGAIVAMVLRAEGFDPMVAGHHREKLMFLASLGLATECEQKLTGSFDVVVDCTGASEGFGRALALVKPRGTLVMKSTAARSANLNLAPVVINEVTVIGSRCGRFGRALEALEARRLDPRPLISAVMALGDGARAIEEAAKPSNFKILLKIP